MCHRVQCSRCGKATWVGCGMHVEQVMKGVPKEQQCQCPRPKGLLARILGR